MEPLGSTSSEYQEIPYGDTTSHDLLVSDPVYQNTGSQPSAAHYRDHDIVGAGRLQSTATPGSQRPKTALKPKTTLSMLPAYGAPQAKTGAGIYEHLTPRDETNQYTSLTDVTKPETAKRMSEATAHGATQGKAGASIYEHVKPSMESNHVYTSLARVKKGKR
nr:hypothetical protein BaRGS_017688 [Batillaria attramentaria]KAG5689205.1 hypothetical protein BaRGS_014861 [Batillaria attramentaria]